MHVDNQFTFKPVGVVRTGASDEEVREGRGESETAVEVFPEFEQALDGLDGFSHIFVLSYLHKLRPDQIGPLRVRPRKLLRAGFKLEELPLVGVFSTDSPTRPNPIGLSLVKLVRREGRKLVVFGLDLWFEALSVVSKHLQFRERLSRSRGFELLETVTGLGARNEPSGFQGSNEPCWRARQTRRMAREQQSKSR
jgi:tRNA-Thr(GGU) m(6)t(6)A37 methyltransferase TsaA